MAKIIDILTTERDRKDVSQFNIVHLYKTGGFYTAYDWSAWLVAVISYTDEVRMRTSDRRPLAVTRIKLATEERTFCKVGFPFKSIEKFIPGHTDFDATDNNHLTLKVKLPEIKDGSELTYERLQTAIDKWTETFPIKQPKGEGDQQDAKPKSEKKAASTTATTTTPAPAAPPAAPANAGLIQQILNYPLSERTPMENIEFIQRLKQQIASIL